MFKQHATKESLLHGGKPNTVRLLSAPVIVVLLFLLAALETILCSVTWHHCMYHQFFLRLLCNLAVSALQLTNQIAELLQTKLIIAF